MKELLEGFHSQLEKAMGIGQSLPALTTKDGSRFSNVLVVGLGGSAFGAEVVRNASAQHLVVPFQISRGYKVPAWVGSNTLIIACSYSGNTEETLDSAEHARQKGAYVFSIASGGNLIEWAKKHQFAFAQIPGGNPPRTAVGYSITLQLIILGKAGLLGDWDYQKEIRESLDILTAFTDFGLAQTIANKLHNHAGIIYCADTIESVAIRLRQQINENAKQLCWHHVVPEMNHNELVGWVKPEFLLERSCVVLLRSSYEHPRVALRFEINKTIIANKAAEMVEIYPKGESLLAQLFYHIAFADWLSLYLAEANGVDAMPVQVIDYLKNELAAKPR